MRINLNSASVNGAQQASFRYDDNGIRVSSTTTTTTYFLTDANNLTGNAQVLEELPAFGATPARSYVIGDDVLAQCGSAVANPSYFSLQDGHANNRQLTQMNGTVLYHYDYEAYGSIQSAISSSAESTAATTKLYCGEQYDTILQMYNLRARYYDPANGRLNQRDTFSGNNEDPITLHKYLYCGADPVNDSDPSGNQDLVSIQFTMGLISWVSGFYLSTSISVLSAIQRIFGPDEDLANIIYTLNVAKIILDAIAIATIAFSLYKLSTWLLSKGINWVTTAAKTLQALEKDEATGTYLVENLIPTDPVNPPAKITPAYQIVRNKLSGTYNYVVMQSGELRLGLQASDELAAGAPLNKHIDLSMGQKVIAAGEAVIEKGKAVFVDDASGHYNGGGLTAAESAAQKSAATTAFQNSGLPLQSYQSVTGR